MRLLEHALEDVKRLRPEAQVLQAHAQIRLVEDADTELLTQQRGHRTDAQVDIAAFGDDAHAAFLRHAFLGDVHLADHLHAADDRRMHAGRRLHQVAQHAVDAVPHARALLVRLDVNIAGAVLDRREQRDVDEIDDRAALDHAVQVRRRTFVNRLALDDFDIALDQAGEKRIDIDVAGGVFLQVFLDVRLNGEHGLNLAFGQAAQAVDGGQALRLDHGDGERIAHLEHGNRPELTPLLVRQHLDEHGIDQAVSQRNAFDTETAGERVGQRGAGAHALLDEQFPKPAAGLALLGQRAVELFSRHRALLEQRFADSLSFSGSIHSYQPSAFSFQL